MIVITLASAPISFMPASTRNGVGSSEHRSEHHACVQRKVLWHRAQDTLHQRTEEHAKENQNHHLAQKIPALTDFLGEELREDQRRQRAKQHHHRRKA